MSSDREFGISLMNFSHWVNPIAVGFFGAQAKVPKASHIAHLVE